jgi:hypothetical protein
VSDEEVKARVAWVLGLTLDELTALRDQSARWYDEVRAKLMPDVTATIRRCPECGHTWHEEGG